MSNASTPAFQFKVHASVERVRGRLLREFSEAISVALKNLNMYIEMPSVMTAAGVGSVRRYARAYNQAQIKDAYVKVIQIKQDEEEGRSKVYVQAVPEK